MELKTLFFVFRMTYDPLMMGYIDARPPNRYLREPWKLTRHLCDETECMKEKGKITEIINIGTKLILSAHFKHIGRVGNFEETTDFRNYLQFHKI